MADTGDWDKALEDMKKTDAQLKITRHPRRSGCRIWLVILGFVGIFIACFISVMFLSGVAEGTWFIPGDAERFDPIVVLAEVQEFAGDDVRLLEMNARYVRADGTLDLNASYNPTVEYVFVRRAETQNNDIPPGAPGYQGGDTLYEYVTVDIKRPFRMMNRTRNGSSSSFMDFGMSRDYRTGTAVNDLLDNLKPPNCSLEQLWQVAKSYDAPSNGVAIIEYTQDGYQFRISDVGINLEFSPDCVIVNS